MQVIKQTIKVPAGRQLRIQLPEEAMASEDAEVIVLFNASPVSRDQRFAAMREAANDPLFLADLNEVMEDDDHALHQNH
jgi:hypothetical protein